MTSTQYLFATALLVSQFFTGVTLGNIVVNETSEVNKAPESQYSPKTESALRGRLILPEGASFFRWEVLAKTDGSIFTFTDGYLPLDAKGRFEIAGVGSAKMNLVFRCFSKAEPDEHGDEPCRVYTSGLVELQEKETVLRLDSGKGLIGRVVFKDTNDPIPDARVILDRQYSKKRSADPTLCLDTAPTHEVRTNAKGEFRFVSPPTGTVRLHIWVTEKARTTLQPFEIKQGDNLKYQDIGLKRDMRITGRILDKKTGKPALPGGTSTEAKARTAVGYKTLHVNYNQQNGAFVISSIPSDLTSLTLSLEGYEKHSLNVRSVNMTGDTNIGDISLEPGAYVCVRLMDSSTGKPFIPRKNNIGMNPLGASFRVISDKAHGEYRNGLKMEEPGWVKYGPLIGKIASVKFKAEGAFPYEMKNIPEPDAKNTINLGEVKLKRLITLMVTVTDKAGKPLSGVKVIMNTANYEADNNRFTGSKGVCEVTSLGPGSSSISLRKEGYKLDRTKIIKITQEPPVQTYHMVMEQGEPSTAGQRFARMLTDRGRIEEAGEDARVRGLKEIGKSETWKLVDLKGVPLFGWLATVDGKMRTPGKDGSLDVAILEPGARKFRLTWEFYEAASHCNISMRGSAEKTGEKTTLIVPVGRVLKGRLLTKTGRAVKGASLYIQSSVGLARSGEEKWMSTYTRNQRGATDEKGHFAIGGMTLGRFRLVFSGRDILDKVVPKIEITAKEDCDMGDIVVTGLKTFTGRIVQAGTDKPVVVLPESIIATAKIKDKQGLVSMNVFDTSSDGNIKLRGPLEEGFSQIRISIKGYAPCVITSKNISESGDFGTVILEREVLKK